MTRTFAFLVVVLGASPLVGQDTAPKPEAVYKSRYRIIDVHVHAPFVSEAATRGHLEVLDRVGVSAINVVLFDPTGWPYPGGWSEANLFAWLDVRKKFADRMLVFGTVDFNRVAKEPNFFADIVTELERGAARGMQGVKIWKNLGMVHKDANGRLLQADDPRLDPFWKACGKLGIPILIHTADPKEYWYPKSYNVFQYDDRADTAKYYKHPTVPPWEDLIAQRDRVLKKHPKTTFIAAHFASMSNDFDGLAKTFDTYPNLYVDCSARLRFMYRYHRQAAHDFFVKYQDRILFGTDAFLPRDEKTLEDPKLLRQWQESKSLFYSRYLEYLETDRVGIMEPGGHFREWMRLSGIKLPAEALEKIYHANAERLIPGVKR
jgi:predicted TIM-barrel fold metal-dependent hydrolase